MKILTYLLMVLVAASAAGGAFAASQEQSFNNPQDSINHRGKALRQSEQDAIFRGGVQGARNYVENLSREEIDALHAKLCKSPYDQLKWNGRYWKCSSATPQQWQERAQNQDRRVCYVCTKPSQVCADYKPVCKDEEVFASVENAQQLNMVKRDICNNSCTSEGAIGTSLWKSCVNECLIKPISAEEMSKLKVGKKVCTEQCVGYKSEYTSRVQCVNYGEKLQPPKGTGWSCKATYNAYK